MTMWMVRAERKGVLFNQFMELGIVAIGWTQAGDFRDDADPGRMEAIFMAAFPEEGRVSNQVAARQVARFIKGPVIGDTVITYSPDQRIYAVGHITSDAIFDTERLTDGEAAWGNLREVSWAHQVARDDLSQTAKNTLGSLLTFFEVKRSVAAEIEALASGERARASGDLPEAAQDDDTDLARATDLEAQALDLISDRIAKLRPDQMEHFIAGLLRALGYATRVSDPGPDRGEDIRATPDALGLQDPRIVVEVKHRKGAIGAPDIRAFLGGRHSGDKGLYVSTGGFSKDAHYEAARANIPLRLLSLKDVVELVVAHYEDLDPDTRRMLPLKRLYWPDD